LCSPYHLRARARIKLERLNKPFTCSPSNRPDILDGRRHVLERMWNSRPKANLVAFHPKSTFNQFFANG
jgi:hypothetical protein